MASASSGTASSALKTEISGGESSSFPFFSSSCSPVAFCLPTPTARRHDCMASSTALIMMRAAAANAAL